MNFDGFLNEFQDFKKKLKKFPDYLSKDSSFDVILKKNCFRIVVVGGVGVGKSSILERLIGIRLPKGPNSCTRRPIIINCDSSRTSTCPDEDIIDMMRAISKEPVVLNLTENLQNVHFEFIDLPGLTSLPRPDQPENYAQLTRELLECYTPDADVILLCLPVDADLVNSDALKFVKALEIDNRVICCLTKLDLLEEGNYEQFENQLESTRTFSGVISLRNAPLLEMSESIELTNEKEGNFFRSRRSDSNIYTFGIENLKNEILKILKKDYNQIKNEISSLLLRESIKLERQLKSMKDPNFTLKLVTDYIENVNKEISGDNEQGTRATCATCGTRIGIILWKRLPEALESIDILKGIDRGHLKILIKNSQGLRTSFQFENAFKILLKNQLKPSETIIFDCLNLIYRELKDFLIIPMSEIEEIEDDEEFYDVKSVSDTEDIEGDGDTVLDTGDVDIQSINDASIKNQLKLLPSLAMTINKTITRILEEAHKKTRKYLEEYCEMQRETVYCNETEYVEVFREYFRGGRGSVGSKGKGGRSAYLNSDSLSSDSLNSGNLGNTNLVSRTTTLDRTSSSSHSTSSLSDDLPLTRIQTESLETLTKQEQDSSGFLKEFLALLFPSVQNIKRVEYRPKKRIIYDKKMGAISNVYVGNAVSTSVTNSDPRVTRDEEFLLKLLEIYLKSHHRQLTNFLPKCINYHLIQETLKQLPLKLLKCPGGSDDHDKSNNMQIGWQAEIKRIERVNKKNIKFLLSKFRSWDMSTGGPNTQRFSPFTPPLRGSFPLDREHTCNNLVGEYLNCLRQYNMSSKKEGNLDTVEATSTEDSSSSSGSNACRSLAKLYLECRMKAGLMTEEDLNSLGF